MFIDPETNFDRFFVALAHCRGEVLFCTDEGDTLNLRSTLSSYIFAALTDNRNLLAHGHILCKDERDYAALSGFLLPEEKTDNL